MRTATLICILAAVAATTACGDDIVEEITNTVDCEDVCSRYADCFDKDYDVSACIDRCEDKADADENQETRLERCDDCMDDKSCTSTAFACTTECLGLVP